LAQRGRGLLFKLRYTPNVSGTVEGTNFKFWMQIDRKGYYAKKIQIQDLNLNFCTWIEGMGPHTIQKMHN